MNKRTIFIALCVSIVGTWGLYFWTAKSFKRVHIEEPDMLIDLKMKLARAELKEFDLKLLKQKNNELEAELKKKDQIINALEAWQNQAVDMNAERLKPKRASLYPVGGNSQILMEKSVKPK
jgi:hypothetical protein